MGKGPAGDWNGEDWTRTCSSKRIEEYVRQIVEELSEVRFEHPEPPRHRCPKCGMETLTLHRKVARCSDPDCAFLLFRMFN